MEYLNCLGAQVSSGKKIINQLLVYHLVEEIFSSVVCVCSTELSRQLCCKCKFKNLNFGASLLILWKLRKQSIAFRKMCRNKKKIQTKKLFNSSLPCTNFRSHKEFTFYVKLYKHRLFFLKILKAYERLIKQHRLSPFAELHCRDSTEKPVVPYSSDSLILT